MYMPSAVKLAAASVYGYGLSTRNSVSPVCEALKHEGLYIAPEPLSADALDRLRTACEVIYAHHPGVVSVESNGSDLRIYGIDRLSDASIFTELQNRFFEDACTFYASSDIKQFVMAGDISYSPDGLGSGSGWHRDSPYRHQFKVIVYLTDADKDQGPFEFVKRSHTTSSVVRTARFLGKPLSEDRFTNQEIGTVIDEGITLAPTTCVGNAGTIIYADTRGLHRGRPLVSGGRRAVTFYIYHKAVPANVEKVTVSAKLA
jgi:hypothetical protein